MWQPDLVLGHKISADLALGHNMSARFGPRT